MPEPELGVDAQEAQGQNEAGLQRQTVATAEEEAAPPLPLPLQLPRARKGVRRREEQRVPRPGDEGPLLPGRRGVPADGPREPPEPQGREGDAGQHVAPVAPVRRPGDGRRVEEGPLRRPLGLGAALHDVLERGRAGHRRPEGRGDGFGAGPGKFLGHLDILMCFFVQSKEVEKRVDDEDERGRATTARRRRR